MQRIVVSLAIFIAIALVPVASFAQGQNVKSLNQQQAQAIADRLSDKYPDYTINVRYNSGTATLIGELYSQEQVADAVNYVKSLPGVDKVTSNLKIMQKQAAQLETVQASSRLRNNNAHVATVSESLVTQNVSQPAVAQQLAPSNAITQVSGRQQMQGVTDFSQQIPSASTTTAPTPVAQSVPVPSLTQPPTVPTPSLEPTVQVSYVDTPQDMPAPPAVSFSPPLNNSYSISTGQETPNLAPQAYGVPMSGNMPLPMGQQAPTAGRYDQPNVPNYAWPTYAAPNNYSEVTYPRLYCPQAAPYIGPFYPYPQVPLEWRKVTLEWHDGYWWLDFDDGTAKGPFSPLFRQPNPRRY